MNSLFEPSAQQQSTTATDENKLTSASYEYTEMLVKFTRAYAILNSIKIDLAHGEKPLSGGWELEVLQVYVNALTQYVTDNQTFHEVFNPLLNATSAEVAFLTTNKDKNDVVAIQGNLDKLLALKEKVQTAFDNVYKTKRDNYTEEQRARNKKCVIL